MDNNLTGNLKKNISEGEGGIRTNCKIIGINIVWHQLKMRTKCGNSIQGALILGSCFLPPTSPLPPNLFFSGLQGVQLPPAHFLAHRRVWAGPSCFLPSLHSWTLLLFPFLQMHPLRSHSTSSSLSSVFISTFCFKDTLTASHIVFQSTVHHTFTYPSSSDRFPTTVSNAAANILIHLPLQIFAAFIWTVYLGVRPRRQRAYIQWILFTAVTPVFRMAVLVTHPPALCEGCHLSTSSLALGIITGLSKMCHLWEA